MARSTPYLHFNGACAEAFTFYQNAFGGELVLDKVGDSPAAAHMPAETHDLVLHCMLTSGELVVMGSDMVGGNGELTAGNMNSIVITSESVAELRDIYAKLVAGGTVGQEIKEEFFGTYGDLTDKFGVSWMFQSDSAPDAASQA